VVSKDDIMYAFKGFDKIYKSFKGIAKDRKKYQENKINEISEKYRPEIEAYLNQENATKALFGNKKQKTLISRIEKAQKVRGTNATESD